MQFIRNGPDVPERLLQAHEDGRVVFFCGAGISYPAGLPDFKGLVMQLFNALGETPNVMQEAAIKKGQFDMAIDLLERDIAGGRNVVRKALPGILTPRQVSSNAIATHEALLALGQTQGGSTRLITTNFDRLFEIAKSCKTIDVKSSQAPELPVPKDRWDSLVYLHGLLPEKRKPEDRELDHLVLSSGDFGLAYLVDRWAARFASELFRNFTVCFVGYSINDAILRYMMDALAADQQLGERSLEMFAFGSYSRGKKAERDNEWKARNVTPILYREHNRHSYLHKTLRAWAGTYEDGAGGKELVVVKAAMADPKASTKQDDFVGRMLWALSDPTGIPAKRFADMDPVPSLNWLQPFCEKRFGQADLMRFGVPPKAANDDGLSFSLARRPSPYGLAPLMALVNHGAHRDQWDEIMRQLGRWLTRHLDDPALLLWAVERGGRLHDQLTQLIEQRLNELAKLEHSGDTAALARIRASAPQAIPSRHMRTLWCLLLTRRVWTPACIIDLYSWQNRVKRDGLTTTLRLELRHALTPRVLLREPIPSRKKLRGTGESERLNELVDWEIQLSTKYVHHNLPALSQIPGWEEALPDLLADFSILLRDVLDLMNELGGANNVRDYYFPDQPSISDHPQNHKTQDWTALIILVRNAWLAQARCCPEQARMIAECWWQMPYPLFWRLAFFAATKDQVISHRRALDWLLAEDRQCLWRTENKRESIRLMVTLADKWNTNELAQLEQAILAGPPRIIFMDNADPNRWTLFVERATWLRLAKLDDAGAALGRLGKARLKELSAKHSDWKLAQDNRDEFVAWMEYGRDGRVDKGELLRPDPTPRRRRELIEWIKQHPSVSDDWPQRCRQKFPTTACALCALTREGIWPTEYWDQALRAWSEKKLTTLSWRRMGKVLAQVSDQKLQCFAHAVGIWLHSIAETWNDPGALFFAMCNRILRLEYQDIDTTKGDPIMLAINHPIGMVTEALLRWWIRGAPEDGQGLPGEIAPSFTKICDTSIGGFQRGRVMLARYVIPLFRVDREWTKEHLLPLFDWQTSEPEARVAWAGFLQSPRLYNPLLKALRKPFLDTAQHYADLGQSGRNYASLLTFVALDHGDTFTQNELVKATRELPEPGLLDAAQTVANSLESAGEKRQQYWKNRAFPYFKSIWPKSRSSLPPGISNGLAQVCLAAQDVFPDAISTLQHYLQPLQDPGDLVLDLNLGDFCKQFPQPSLNFLDRLIGKRVEWMLKDLKSCLQEIQASKPELQDDKRFQRLWEYIRYADLDEK